MATAKQQSVELGVRTAEVDRLEADLAQAERAHSARSAAGRPPEETRADQLVLQAKANVLEKVKVGAPIVGLKNMDNFPILQVLGKVQVVGSSTLPFNHGRVGLLLVIVNQNVNPKRKARQGVATYDNELPKAILC